MKQEKYQGGKNACLFMFKLVKFHQNQANQLPK